MKMTVHVMKMTVHESNFGLKTIYTLEISRRDFAIMRLEPYERAILQQDSSTDAVPDILAKLVTLTHAIERSSEKGEEL